MASNDSEEIEITHGCFPTAEPQAPAEKELAGRGPVGPDSLAIPAGDLEPRQAVPDSDGPVSTVVCSAACYSTTTENTEVKTTPKKVASNITKKTAIPSL